MAPLLTAALLLFWFLHTHPSLDCIVVIAVVTIDQPLGAQELGFAPRPKQLLGGHTVVGEESASREGRGGQDADPADFLCSQQRTEQKINAHCHPEGQQ